MSDPGPLPIVDAGSILQEESVQAFKAILPIRQYKFRDERIDDFGVDGSLELIADGKATNIRAQVQLKGRSNTSPNIDGSISVSVPTANLNYLRNGICPLYVLYRPELKEIRFCFARDEWARIEREKPTWKQQGTVTVHFHRVLDTDSLAELRARITQEATTRRDVDDRVHRLRLEAAHVTIDARTLAVTDSAETVRLLSEDGQALADSGYAATVVEKARAIPSSALIAEPRAALAVAYANFHLARYYDASASLRTLMLGGPVLGPHNQALLDVLFISVQRMLGEIDEDTYDQRMRDWATRAPAELAIQNEIARAWSEHRMAIATGRTATEHAGARAHLQNVLARGRAVAGANYLYYIELLELTLRQHDVEDGLIDASAVRDFADRGVGDAHNARVIDRAAREAATVWFEQLTSLEARTRTTVRYTHCEVRLLHGHAVISRLGQKQLHFLAGRGPALSAETIDAIFAGLNETVQVARALEHRQLELRALWNLARGLDLFGRSDEATKLATETLKLAEISGCGLEAGHLKEFLDAETRTESRVRQLKEVVSLSEEELLLKASDDQLSFVAVTLAAAWQLPEARVPNVQTSLQYQRRMAIERRDWCEHVVLSEYRHSSLVRLFAEPPLLKVVCESFGHEAPVTLTDGPANATANFRERFCRGCAYRRPAGGQQVSKTRTRNQAKAERRRRREDG